MRQNECNEHTHNKGHAIGIGCRQVCECHICHRPTAKRQQNAKRKASPSIDITQELDQELGNNAHEFILAKNVVVSSP